MDEPSYAEQAHVIYEVFGIKMTPEQIDRMHEETKDMWEMYKRTCLPGWRDDG